jgi:hypothetical protein
VIDDQRSEQITGGARHDRAPPTRRALRPIAARATGLERSITAGPARSARQGDVAFEDGRGHTALYLRAPRMLQDLAIARGDGRLPKVLAGWARIDVLVVDDLALQPLAATQAADLLEVLEDRAQRRSTIVTSQLPVSGWQDSLGDATVADAILDRQVHNAHRLELRGDSLRQPRTAADERTPAAATGANEAKAAERRAGRRSEALRSPERPAEQRA